MYSFVVLPLNLTLLLFHFGYFLTLLELFSLCWGWDPKLAPSRIFLLLFGFPGSLIGFSRWWLSVKYHSWAFGLAPGRWCCCLGRVRNLQGGALLEEVVTWAGLCLPAVGLFPCVFPFSHLNLTLFLHLCCRWKMDFSGFPLKSPITEALCDFSR